MIPFVKPGANQPYPDMAARALRAALADAGIDYGLVPRACWAWPGPRARQLRRFNVRFQGITHLGNVIPCRGTVVFRQLRGLP